MDVVAGCIGDHLGPAYALSVCLPYTKEPALQAPPLTLWQNPRSYKVSRLVVPAALLNAPERHHVFAEVREPPVPINEARHLVDVEGELVDDPEFVEDVIVVGVNLADTVQHDPQRTA